MKLLNDKSKESYMDIINSMLNDSTWTDLTKNQVYKFENGRDLWINGNNHLTYALNSSSGKVKIKLNNFEYYYVEYVNDFTLFLYNEKEKFRLMPEYV